MSKDNLDPISIEKLIAIARQGQPKFRRIRKPSKRTENHEKVFINWLRQENVELGVKEVRAKDLYKIYCSQIRLNGLAVPSLSSFGTIAGKHLSKRRRKFGFIFLLNRIPTLMR